MPEASDLPADPLADLKAELERLHPASFAWSLACCSGNRHRAEEALQAAYLKVLAGRARFDGRSSLKTWLFAVIRRTAAGRRRRHALRRRLLEGWWLRRAGPVPEASPGEQVGRSETVQRVRRGLAALSSRQRQVLELVFYQDMTIEEASRVLGVSLGTARTHYARGKAALLAVLSEEGA
ncbi:MAG: RNA polymerase sigma factor [Thermoanaerobaculia bacterium]